jgi:hypothetical protein
MAKRKLKKRLRANPSRPTVHDRRNQTSMPGTVSLVVDDPYGVEPGDKIIVMRSLRDDPLAAMHNSRQVDEAQFLAGRHWQRQHETAELGVIKAIDPTKEAVDGGRFAEPLTDEKAKALGALARSARLLGLEGNAIVNDILGAGMTVRQAAEKRNLSTEQERKYVGRRFRECLDTLAHFFGYASRGPASMS